MTLRYPTSDMVLGLKGQSSQVTKCKSIFKAIEWLAWVSTFIKGLSSSFFYKYVLFLFTEISPCYMDKWSWVELVEFNVPLDT